MLMQERKHSRNDFAAMSHQHMTTRVIGHEHAMRNMAGDELCVRVGAIQVIFSTDRKRGCSDGFQRLREVLNGQLSFK